MLTSSSHSTALKPYAALRRHLFPPSSSFKFHSTSSCSKAWRRVDFHGYLLNCQAISKPQTQSELYGIPVIKWNEIEDEEDVLDEETVKDSTTEGICDQIEMVRSMLRSMGDGEINASAYDVAWVALVEDVTTSGQPQFPSALEWISNNQLLDGSWGDSILFSAHDRIICTLACVTALKTWNVHPEKVQRGTYHRMTHSIFSNQRLISVSNW
ncbi:hypothetical protein QQ045_025067 [Rhodiola kirilowii]